MTTDSCPAEDLATTTLGNRPARPLQVTATVGDVGRGGNGLVTESTGITWNAQGDVAAYRVTFSINRTETRSGRSRTRPTAAIYAGSSFASLGLGPRASLVAAGRPRSSTMSRSTMRDDVDALDPTIIIRPARAGVKTAFLHVGE